MKKILAVSGALVLAVCFLMSAAWGKDAAANSDILATVGETQITQEDIVLLQNCDSVVRSFQGARGQGVSEEEALNQLIVEQIKRQMIQDEGICLSQEEQKQISDSILWSFDEVEDILQNGTEQEKAMAEQSQSVVQAFAQAYGVSMEEYKDLCIRETLFSVEVSKLADKLFGGDREALEDYIQEHYEDYQVIIN